MVVSLLAYANSTFPDDGFATVTTNEVVPADLFDGCWTTAPAIPSGPYSAKVRPTTWLCVVIPNADNCAGEMFVVPGGTDTE